MARQDRHPASLVSRIREQLLLASGGNAEAVHALRVSIKKLRPIMDAVRLSDPDCILLDRDFSRIRKLFRTAGLLREMQVFRAWMVHHFGEIPVELSGPLESAETAAMTSWISLLQQYERCLPASLQRIRKALKKTSPEAMVPCARQMLIHEQARLCHLVLQLQSEQDLHNARKSIKRMLSLLSLADATSYAKWIIIATGVANMIGERHDRYVAWHFMVKTGRPELQGHAEKIRDGLSGTFEQAANALNGLVSALPVT